jgi:hypothetical protein
MQPQSHQHQHQPLNEGLEQGDLARLVHPELHIDEFKSKLGRDEDVCVLSFKVTGKEAATDVVNFIEKGYMWVIDADVSSGEMDDGDYIVFVECDRDGGVPENVMELMEDLMNITGQELSEWHVQYHTDVTEHPLDIETLEQLVPTNADAYRNRFGHEDIDKLKTAAGIKVDTKAPKNDFTESLRIAAGIR